MGQERVMIVAQGIMDDLLSTMSDSKLYSVSSMIARNRKALDVFDYELDLSAKDNWNVILNELENYGWGKFTLKGDQIKVEHHIPIYVGAQGPKMLQLAGAIGDGPSLTRLTRTT